MKKLAIYALILALFSPFCAFAEETEATDLLEEVVEEVVTDVVADEAADETADVATDTAANVEPVVTEKTDMGDPIVNINRKWKFQVLSWDTELTGHVQISDDDNVNNAEKITFGKDISFSKEKIPGFRASYAWGGRTTFEFSYANQDHDGKLSVKRKFNGKNFNVDASLRLQNEWVDLAWIRKLSHSFNEEGHEKNYFSGIFGIKANYTNIELTNPVAAGLTVGARAEWAEAIPIPYLGIEGGVLMGKSLWLKANCRIFKLTYDEYSAEHHDYIVNVAYRLNEQNKNQDWFFNVGYRDVNYDISGDGDSVLIEYKGPIVGVDVHF